MTNGVKTNHFGFLLFQGAETLPPADDAALAPHQVVADLMETLLLLRGPAHKPELKLHSSNFKNTFEYENFQCDFIKTAPKSLLFLY